MNNKVQLLKALADENRMAILRVLNEKAMYVEVLSERLSLSASTVSFHLKKLEKANAVKSYKDQYYKVFEINPKVLNLNLMEFITSSPTKASEEKREVAYEDKIIKTFIKYGKLTSIPVQRKKRLVILKHLVKHFDDEKEYSEDEVNAVIEDYHEDFCTLRREFIAEKLMTRKSGTYKKTRH